MGKTRGFLSVSPFLNKALNYQRPVWADTWLLGAWSRRVLLLVWLWLRMVGVCASISTEVMIIVSVGLPVYPASESCCATCTHTQSHTQSYISEAEKYHLYQGHGLLRLRTHSLSVTQALSGLWFSSLFCKILESLSGGHKMYFWGSGSWESSCILGVWELSSPRP